MDRDESAENKYHKFGKHLLKSTTGTKQDKNFEKKQ